MAVFLACAVEAVEALTIVLAAGTSRDWRSAIAGVIGGVALLAAVVAVLGPAVAAIPLQGLRLVVGGLLLVFGLQWLRKAVLRASGSQSPARRGRHLRAGGGRRRSGCDPPARDGHRLVRVHALVQGCGA